MKAIKSRGVMLVAAVMVIVVISILGVTLASMLGVTSRGCVDYLRSSQAFALAQAGLNWYMKQLQGIKNWSTTTAPAAQSLGLGTFEIVINTQSLSQINFTVTGNITFTDKDGTTKVVKRTMTQTAHKFPSAYQASPAFGLFWGYDPGTVLTFSGVAVSGNIWAVGSTSGSAGGGATIYHPVGTTAVGTNILTTSSLAMPVIDKTAYGDLMNGYDTDIANDGSANVTPVTSNIVLTGNTLNYRDFITQGNITISGFGKIVASRDVLLHTSGANNKTLNIVPSAGGTIEILAGRNFQINVNSGNDKYTININTANTGKVIMYAANNTGTGDAFIIQERRTADPTSIVGALIMSRRNLTVCNNTSDVSGPSILKSTLFLDYNTSSDANNYLLITGSTTVVGNNSAGAANGPCVIISLGRSSAASPNPCGLTIHSNADVTGLAYQNDINVTGISDNAALTRINTATFRGTLIANRFQGDSITSGDFTSDQSFTANFNQDADILPNGFSSKAANSWIDN